MSPSPPVRYRILPSSPEAHLYTVTCTIVDPDRGGQRLSMPTWIPGSYLVREFARHVTRISARSGALAVPLEKIDKNTWLAAPTAAALSVEYEVYGFDPSVRAAYLDTARGFFNGPCVFLRVHGCEDRRHEVEVQPPRGARYRKWRVATAMSARNVKRHGFGLYQAGGYDELIDHPVEMGEFSLASFRASGVRHEIVISGRHDADLPRLARDLRKLCETQIGFWGEAAMKRYLFLVNAVGSGYGGLEHRASTALIAGRDDLPRRGVRQPDERYRTFLGLASHEYFHAWNVKRIKPAAFAPYDLDRENYTRLLWAFEGITSYYDDLLLVRAGLLSEQAYLEALGRTITQVRRGPGRLKQTVAESSFDAWIKYYRQDENSPNSMVSYYQKGSLVALCLDLLIREKTSGRRSLDRVMRALWRRHGRRGEGVDEDGIERIAAQVSGLRLNGFFDRALRSTRDLPLERLLAGVGIKVAWRAAESLSDRGGKPASRPGAERAIRADLAIRTRAEGTELVLSHVLDGGAAQKAGLSVGDSIVAIDGFKVDARNFEERLNRLRPGRPCTMHAFRRDELMRFDVTPAPAARDTCVLTATPDRRAARRRRAWLGITSARRADTLPAKPADRG
jgi:predicted metalloprotease with PDZ domain